jgi:pimeloyl-ACP methyl ester carboxylesterase
MPGRSRELAWVSRGFLDPLAQLAERGVPILIVYGTADVEYRDYQRACAEGLDPMLGTWPTVSVQTLEGQVHAFTRVASQAPTRHAIAEWVEATAANDRGVRAPEVS